MARSTTLPHPLRSPRATPACSAGRGPRLAPLTPAQVLLLSDAACRYDGGVILPERLKGKAAEKVVQALTDKGFVREVRAKADLPVWRRDGETGRDFALVLTRLGRAAVPTEDPAPEQAAVGETRARAASREANTVLATAPDPLPRMAEAGSDGSGMVENPAPNPKKDAGLAPRPGSKLGAVIALLGRDTGASVEEIMAATSWLPHTTRAALTGLRKRGFALTRARAETGSVYRIDADLAA